MAKTQELFHEISNWHNKISVVAGVACELLKHKGLDTLTQNELTEKNSHLISIFNQIEQFVFGANKAIAQLRDIIPSSN